MPCKKKLAGSAKNGVAKHQNDGSEERNDSANNGIAELIEHIEVVLGATDSAVAPLRSADAGPTDLLTRLRIVQCHASISYVRGHQALSIDLFWSGASPTPSQDANEAVERLQRQSEAVNVWFFGPNM